MNVGVALFTSKDKPVDGLASMNGDIPFKFMTIGDLRSDCLWITNLNYNELRKINLSVNTKIRMSDFFRISLERIAADLGINLETSQFSACRILSEISHRTLVAASNLYNIDKFNFSLKDSIQSVIANDNGLESDNTNISIAINESYQSYQRCFGKPPTGADFYSLRINRQKYGLFIQNCLIPSGGWRTLKDSRFPIKNTDHKKGAESVCYKFLVNAINKAPCLVQMTVKNIDKEVANLLDHGNGTNQRDWVPAHEAALIAMHGNIVINAMMYSEAYKKIAPEHAAKLKALDSTQSASYSFGLIADNHIAALKSKSFNSKLEKSKFASSRASWFAAWDRVLLFKYAEKLQFDGFYVAGYGGGAIHVMCEPHNVNSLNEVCNSLGITKPMILSNKKDNEDTQIITNQFYKKIYGA